MAFKKQWFEEEISEVVRGQDEVIRKVWLAFFAGGHVLLEDEPGVGKTLLAQTMSAVLNLPFARVQMTPDLLPMDLLGGLFWSPVKGDFVFKKGPVFTTVLLLDELNRASPKTQSAVLQAMEERKITLDGEDHPLPEEFFVMATQNPFDQVGTYPLPMSQLDRFSLKISMMPLAAEEERKLLQIESRQQLLGRSWKRLSQGEIKQIREKAQKVSLGTQIEQWIFKYKTKLDQEKNLGFSLRTLQSWVRMAKFQAHFEGRDFLIPEDLIFLAVSALHHRVHAKRVAPSESNSFRKDLSEALKDLAVFS